jgi:hypothetical protein
LTLTYDDLSRQLESGGLAARGGFHPEPGDALADIDGRPVGTVVLIGFTGIQHWSVFANSPEFSDGLANPLDRWSKRTIDILAQQYAGRALYPFDAAASGPPWWPFQRWARRALTLYTSPLGVLIDPQFGLWHSYRGALALTAELALPSPKPWPNPCESCQTKPCLHTCPVGAVQAGAYDVDICRAQVRSTATGCRTIGCLARRACPVGAENSHLPAQARFHMGAFAGAPGSPG